MIELLWFIVGQFIGGIVTAIILCCFQINRINEYEAKIRSLRAQLKNK